MRKIVVIGIGQFGFSLIKEISLLGFDCVAIDKDKDRINAIKNLISNAVNLNATDEESMKSLGLENYDVGVVAIGSDLETSILITLILKEIGVKEIIAKSVSDIHSRLLKKVGATTVVIPEAESGESIANKIITPTILDFVRIKEDFMLFEIHPPEHFVGKKLKEINLRNKYNVSIISIVKSQPQKEIDKHIIMPGPEDKIEKDDIIILVGASEDLEKLKKGEKIS